LTSCWAGRQQLDFVGYNEERAQRIIHFLRPRFYFVQKGHNLHLLGFDHTRLTYRFQGRDYRLTDVFGNVVKDILA
jgi:hypothetical protein